MHPFSDPIFCSILLHAYTPRGVRGYSLSSNIILPFIYKVVFYMRAFIYPHARYTSCTSHSRVFNCYNNIMWREQIWPTFTPLFFFSKKEKKTVLKYPYSYLGRCQDLGHIDKWCHNCVSSISQYQSIQNPCGKRWCMLRRIRTVTSC